jgi:hypothetical protein
MAAAFAGLGFRSSATSRSATSHITCSLALVRVGASVSGSAGTAVINGLSRISRTLRAEFRIDGSPEMRLPVSRRVMDESGATAVEFALTIPLFLTLPV